MVIPYSLQPLLAELTPLVAVVLVVVAQAVVPTVGLAAAPFVVVEQAVVPSVGLVAASFVVVEQIVVALLLADILLDRASLLIVLAKPAVRNLC